MLELAADGSQHSIRDVTAQLAGVFHLTPAEVQELLPSGQQSAFRNRVAWAKTHLKMAGLLDSERRGFFKITQQGLQVLAQNPTRVDLRILREQPGYLKARDGQKEGPSADSSPLVEDPQTPEEQIENAYIILRQSLGSELLSRILGSSPEFFEKTVVELLVSMGYGGTRKDAGLAIGRSGDEGIDGIIKEDRLGLDTIYIQAKRWLQTVSRPEIQKFAGALQGFRAKKGIFITTSEFSREAREYADKIENRIVLIDGTMLWNLMLDFGIGVSKTASYQINKIDHDYFDEENS